MSIAKKMIAVSSVLALSAALTGCAGDAELRQQSIRNQNHIPNTNMYQQNRNQAPNAAWNRNNGMNQNQAQTRNQRNQGDNRVVIADEAAEQIVAIPGIRQANVLVTENNAFVAAVWDENHQNNKMTREIEDRIAQRVRSVDPDIENVYVSTNPDFVDRVNTYADDIRQGRPVAGFAEQFNEMIQRLFPNAR